MLDFFQQDEVQKGLYEYLREKNIPQFSRYVKVVEAGKGQLIYDVGQQETDIYEIQQGVLKLGGKTSTDEGFVYELVTQGEIFGNVSFLNKPFREYGKVVIPAKLYAFNRDFFVHQVLRDPGATELFIKKIIHRWHKTESILSAIRHFEPRERIAKMFESLNFSIPVDKDRKIVLNKNLTYKDIADLTGTTRQLVAEILR